MLLAPFEVGFFTIEALERGGSRLVQPRSIEQRVTVLEQQMQEMRDLPARVTNLESQILQLRKEMREEFSDSVGVSQRAVHAVDNRGEHAAVTTLKEAIAGTNTHMRALHEDVISRIATIGERRQPRKRR